MARSHSGDFHPGGSDVDLLVVSDDPIDGLASVVEREWEQERANLDLRVVRYAVAAEPTRALRWHSPCQSPPSTASASSETGTSPTSVIEFSVCRQLGHSDVIGAVPNEWVDQVGAEVVERWKRIGHDPPHHELMALTACRIWRFREERIHCSKPSAAAWARARGAVVAFDEESVRALLRAS